MSNKDLADFFKKYVTNYTLGTDDVVSKYVGDQDKQVTISVCDVGGSSCSSCRFLLFSFPPSCHSSL